MYVRTDGRTYVRMKIEKPGVGRPLLGPANNSSVENNSGGTLKN